MKLQKSEDKTESGTNLVDADNKIIADEYKDWCKIQKNSEE